jgi:uncharacterized membrane protein
MASEKFRTQLRQEASLWINEGLIDPQVYEQLSNRYQFNTLDRAAHNRFVTILVGLGSILVGLGVITFVASNWEDLSREAKVLLLMGLFISVNICGFYLWRYHQAARQRFGQGLLLLGSLVLGANMGLMGQMFHINGPFYELLLAWAVGVLAMAYSLRLISLGVLAFILMGLGYWGFWSDNWGWSWFNSASTPADWSSLLSLHMPILAGLMFIPLAYLCRSKVVFCLGAIAVVSSLVSNLQYVGAIADSPLFVGFLVAIAFAVPAALLWAYDDSLWLRNISQPIFQPVARHLALWCLALSCYQYSSVWFWDSFSGSTNTSPTNIDFLPFLNILILVGLTLFSWLRLIYSRRWQITNVTIGGFLLAIAFLPIWHISVSSINLLAVFIGNILLFILSIGLIREGLALGERRAFWGGTILITLRIVNWFLLSNTELLLKSFVLVLAGVGVILIALWFERYVRTLSVSRS